MYISIHFFSFTPKNPFPKPIHFHNAFLYQTSQELLIYATTKRPM